ncbi:hypothetical protein ACP70R_042213 [Stipagrostis hirtigluma subsp. patula]
MAVAAAAPATVGESMAHVSRAATWAVAAVIQTAIAGYFVGVAYVFKSGVSPSFFSSAPWRLPLWASLGVYLSLAFLVMFYIDLFLPRAPVAVQKRFTGVAIWLVGVVALNLMVSVVLGAGVKDGRVLIACTCVVAAFAVGIVVFWAWLVGRYGGHQLDCSNAADPRHGGRSPEFVGQQQPHVVAPRLPI